MYANVEETVSYPTNKLLLVSSLSVQLVYLSTSPKLSTDKLKQYVGSECMQLLVSMIIPLALPD